MDTAKDLKGSVLARMDGKSPFGVWTPVDFIDLGSRPAVDQVLHRLTANGAIRRVTRGLYDKPAKNKLTGKDTTPDPRAVIDALVRRDSIRVLLDGMTAANDLGLTDAVPARVNSVLDLNSGLSQQAHCNVPHVFQVPLGCS